LGPSSASPHELTMMTGGRPAARVHRSAPDKTKRVPRRIREDPPALLPITDVEQCGAQLEDLLLGLVKVLGMQVEVKLLRTSGVRPPRRLMIIHALESEHEPAVGVERRPRVIERPPRIRPIHLATKKRLVEPGQLNDIGAVQHHTLQVGDHEGSLDPLQQAPSGPDPCSIGHGTGTTIRSVGMGGPSRVIEKQLSLGPMLHARRCASADGYSLGSSAGSSTIPCLQRSFGGRRDLPTAGRRRLQLAASDRSFPVTTARSGTQRARRSGFQDRGGAIDLAAH
jgi:hypothetical protein